MDIHSQLTTGVLRVGALVSGRGAYARRRLSF